jgi:hypothetical protein
MQISNLPASNSFSSTDVLPIEINGVTYKVTGATLAAALQTLGNYLTTENVANNLTTTAAGSVLDARQGKVLNKAITNQILKPSTTIPIPASGSSASYSMSGLTSDHELVRWNFSSSAENAPPVGLTLTTYNGYFTITNDGGTTSESIRPVFALPTAIAITAR